MNTEEKLQLELTDEEFANYRLFKHYVLLDSARDDALKAENDAEELRNAAMAVGQEALSKGDLAAKLMVVNLSITTHMLTQLTSMRIDNLSQAIYETEKQMFPVSQELKVLQDKLQPILRRIREAEETQAKQEAINLPFSATVDPNDRPSA